MTHEPKIPMAKSMIHRPTVPNPTTRDLSIPISSPSNKTDSTREPCQCRRMSRRSSPSSDPLDEDDTLVESENDDDEDIDNGIKGVYYEAEDGELTPVVW